MYPRFSILFTSFILVLIILEGCNNDNDPKPQVDNEINEFVWGGLNSWYFWQDEVESLQDSWLKKDKELAEFLNSYSDPKLLYEDLKYQDDRFSRIVDDYEYLENLFQGITKSFGYELGLAKIDSLNLLGYIKYVLDDSPADLAGLKRGDLFKIVNGTALTIDNYGALLFENENYTIELAQIVDGQLQNTGTEISLSAIQLTENPVYLTKILEVEGTKIGYLVYNQFTHTFHSQLNEAFGTLLNGGIQELVLDLRYNGGGSILTAQHLASMIYSEASSQTIFTQYVFNQKKSDINFQLPFLNQVSIVDGSFNVIANEHMNRLNISRVYILISGSTASASELIINGLSPYIEVKLIGTRTVGKNEGSITLYDAPKADYLEKGRANPNHKWAMQPIILQLANANNFGDYAGGFEPDIEISEISYLGDLKPLGDVEEQLLQVAIADITGIVARIDTERIPLTQHPYYFTKTIFDQEMYLNGLR